MSDVIDRPILAEEVAAQSRLRIIDCDVHPSIHAHSDLDPFLPKRWQRVDAAGLSVRADSSPFRSAEDKSRETASWFKRSLLFPSPT